MQQDQNSNPPPSHNDAMITLFLKDRDEPCPSCGYNRRDGTTSTCPECGSQLELVSADQNYTKLAKYILMLIWIGASLQLLSNLMSWAQYILAFPLIGMPTGYVPYLIAQSISSIFWVSILILAARRWRCARRNEPIAVRAVLALMFSILGFRFASMVFSTVMQLF